jgi:ADP-ribosylglycohydrolase
MNLPADYAERVYAGVLGKIIGVYLGRPFEGWTYERIMAELGEIYYYVHEKLNKPLIVTDDDIAGTFTFLRALPDHDNRRELTPAQIGQTWLNYIIEERTILWWGGLGNSTEHTAYLRLKDGIPAPRSGSMALNGKVVAEQIGSQIFIDGWAMVAPGDPELAADLARRAASVSHDGEAIYGAQVLAAMEAQAFVEPDIDALIDTGVTFIPRDSVIYRMIAEIRGWRAKEDDWRAAREQLATRYGYDQYGGNCHMVPNHGLIIHSLLYGDDDFQKTLMIVNTSGWDTDCNSGNVGCLMGIKNGLSGLETGPDWRGPLADRLYLPTADGGRAITDAVTETFHIVNIGRALAAEPPLAPKDGARFHFELPGALHGFRPEDSPESRGTIAVQNVRGHSLTGQRSLALRYHHVAQGRPARVSTPTFIPPEAIEMPGYSLIASPTLYPGQTLLAGFSTSDESQVPVTCRLFVRAYGADDRLCTYYGPDAELTPRSALEFSWRLDDTNGGSFEAVGPIAQVGVELSSVHRADGTVYLDYLTWEEAPEVVFTRPAHAGTLWRRAWVDGVDKFVSTPEPFRLIQNTGTGLLIQGSREWTDYRVSADVTPHLVTAAGIAARVQGMRRYYALLLTNDRKARLVKVLDNPTVLAETDFDWSLGATYDLGLEVIGPRLRAGINGNKLFEFTDADAPFLAGAVGLVCEQGRTATQAVTVRPTHWPVFSIE